jgi:ABC-type dipeptide/oligopeptide/nickel transport system ATPase subunit
MLEARDLVFGHGRRAPLVLDGVGLTIRPGEILGLSGPSGCGKTTLGRLLAGHLRPHSGSVHADGSPLPASGFRPVQLLPQTPLLAMNPRWRIGRILTEAWKPSEADRAGFGISADWLDRYPHELSGGQLQRVSILRSLAPGTRYLVADEITGALDAIGQAEIWTLLQAVTRQRAIGVLAISHDRALLGRIADACLCLPDMTVAIDQRNDQRISA